MNVTSSLKICGDNYANVICTSSNENVVTVSNNNSELTYSTLSKGISTIKCYASTNDKETFTFKINVE